MSDRLLAELVLPDGILAWSSHRLEIAFSTVAASAGTPEPLLRSAWQILASRDLDENVYQFCRALNATTMGIYRSAGWDLAWMCGDATPAQMCLRYWTLGVRPELWDDRIERATLGVLQRYPFEW